MPTTNLKLETLKGTDNVRESMLAKMNENFSKIDKAYKVLTDNLLQKTGKDNLAEAIQYVGNLENTSSATADASKILKGYTAYNGTGKITGTALSTKTNIISSVLKSGYKGYTNEGTLINGGLVTNVCYVSANTPANSQGNNNDLWVVTGG